LIPSIPLNKVNNPKNTNPNPPRTITQLSSILNPIKIAPADKIKIRRIIGDLYYY